MSQSLALPTDVYARHALQHERRMVEEYNRRIAREGAKMHAAFANACWRQAAFEWLLYEDAEAVKSLWHKAGRALSDDILTTQNAAASPTADTVLCLHFAVAAGDKHLIEKLSIHLNARAQTVLAEGYISLLRALFYADASRATLENRLRHAAHAAQTLAVATDDLAVAAHKKNADFDALETGWQVTEQQAVGAGLKIIAHYVWQKLEREQSKNYSHAARQTASQIKRADFAVTTSTADTNPTAAAATATRRTLCEVITGALHHLVAYVYASVSHQPKLSTWLPGIALCNLACAAQLDVRTAPQTADEIWKSRLPLKLLKPFD